MNQRVTPVKVSEPVYKPTEPMNMLIVEDPGSDWGAVYVYGELAYEGHVSDLYEKALEFVGVCTMQRACTDPMPADPQKFWDE